MALSLVLIFICPPIFFTVHAVLSRIFSSKPRQKIAIFSILLSEMICAALLYGLTYVDYAFSDISHISGLIYAAAALLSIGYIYFHTFNMGETARRIRILMEIRSRGSISESDLIRTFNEAEPIRVRLDRLVHLGQIEFKEGSYYLKSRSLLRTALLVSGWRRLLGL